MSRKKVKYRSKFEIAVAAALKSAGVRADYETETLTYFTRVRAGECSECGSCEVYKRRQYTPDFVVKPKGSRSASRIYIEAKGKLTPSERAKLIAISKAGYDVRLVFQRDNYVSRKKKTRYTEWATSHGFKSTVLHSRKVSNLKSLIS